MTETGIVFRGKKNANIISALSKKYNLSLEKATEIFFNSETAAMIEDGVADLHCRSDLYLAQCVWDEYQEEANAVS